MPQLPLQLMRAPLPDSADQAGVLRLANDADLQTVDLHQVQRIELNFPKFTDGRAYSQAWWLRRRQGFQGDIRACGDVRVDQLQQMARSGFSSAVLIEGEDLALGQQLLSRFHGFYQGDALQAQPHFQPATGSQASGGAA
jgi:uncharacterized protein (DUF934 family)